MVVVAWEGGVRIELDETEAIELLGFLAQFYAGDKSVPDTLCARLEDAFPQGE